MTSTNIYLLRNISLCNKYTNWYVSIITKAILRLPRPSSKNNLRTLATQLFGYCEVHHILPKSLGGLDSLDNYVALTAKEHFIVHKLLSKMFLGESRIKMLHAVNAFSRASPGQHRILTARQFEFAKQCQSAAMSSKVSPKKGKPGSPCPEWKKAAQRGKTWKHSLETIEKMRKPKQYKVNNTQHTITCPHCGKSGGHKTMPRWHFDNCKFKP